MSKMAHHVLQCPHCRHVQETVVWGSINVSLDPELKKKLFAGEINLFTCRKCQQKSFVNAPLLYHDMDLQFLVHYYPPAVLNDESFCSDFNADGSLAFVGMPPENAKAGEHFRRPHIVFDMKEMIRYVIFRERVAATSKKK